MDKLAGHFKIGLRLLARRPGLSAGRLLTVTMVVSAVSAVFAVANATFLRPLPFPDADRLLRIYLQPPGTTDFASANPLTPLEFERFRQRTTRLERFEGIWTSERAIAGDGEPEAVPAGRVSAGFFRILGTGAILGRVFTEQEVAADEKLVVLGHGMWVRRYGGDPSAVGRTLLVDREVHSIIGVMPASFEPALAPSEFWTPLSTRNPMARTQLSSVQTMGLLRAGVTREQVLPELEVIFEGLRQETPAVLKVDAPLVAIVSRGFARRFWPGQDPIGRRLKRGATATAWSTVVGVVDDVRDVALDQAPAETVYTPYYQGSSPAAPVGLVVRTAGDPRAMVTAIKQAVWAVDAKQPLANVITLEQFLAASLGAQRFRAMLVAVCGMIGLLLATIGTYGVTARSVVERTREVGIRLALGGRAVDVWWTVAWGSLKAVVAGAIAGIAASIAAAAGLAALLPEVRGQAWIFAMVCGCILVTVGAVAALAAARGVISIEPLRALRTD